ncbi:MAG: hypothetical protein ACYTGG_05420 [Planctomycetota bacterium]|jgi:prephenate dehydratase
MSATWNSMPYFAFSLPDRPGELARFAAGLGEAGINMIGLWGYASGRDEPRLSCVPEDPASFRDFARTAGLEVEEGHALYLTGESAAGALVETLQRIATAGINLEAVEAVGAGDHYGCFIWAAENDRDALQNLLA